MHDTSSGTPVARGMRKAPGGLYELVDAPEDPSL
jgi:hypothetical protein